jgi:glycosyltransferase involved in cell wall biosynthesis
VVPPARNAARVVTVHDLTAIRFPELCTDASKRYPALVARAVRDGAHVHTLTNFVASDVEELLGVPPERIHVIAPGIAPYASVDLPAATPRAPYIFAIGTIEPRKDYPTLIEAFDIVAAEDPDVQLLIAGQPGWGSGAFERALQSSRCSDRVRVLGRITDEQYAAYLRQASVLAYPSIYEGFGYPPLEAMRAGVPVVATRVASLPEVCGDAAVLVEPRAADALADALTRVLTDVHLREALIEKGCQRVEQFQWKNAGTRFVELYKGLT